MRRVTPLSILIIASAVILAALWLLHPVSTASAEAEEINGVGATWYNADWQYRRPVTITNSSTALSNYQVLVKLDDTNFDFTKANSDGSDLRVTANDGVTELPFWIESWSSPLAYIWVKVPNIAASGTTSVFFYFGDAAATSASNGDQTFDFFDDDWCQFSGVSGCGGPTNPVLSAGQSWWETTTGYPMVFEDTSFMPTRPQYHMLYSGFNVIGYAKGYAWSSDLNTWTEYDTGGAHPPDPNPVMGVGYGGDANLTYGDTVKVGDTYKMLAIRGSAQLITSTNLIDWSGFTPLTINSGTVGSGMAVLKEGDGITPVVAGGHYWMVYFQSSTQGSMYLAYSDDLVTWTTTGAPILYPSTSWDLGGLWTPSFIQIDNTYYIYYQGLNSAPSPYWEIGFAKADASGGTPPASAASWTKSTDTVIKRGDSGSWDSTYAIHPMFRHFSNGTYYVFYTGNSAIGYAYADNPEGPWTKLGGASTQWTLTGGTPSVTNGILTLSPNHGIVSLNSFQNQTVGFRANFGVGSGLQWGGFISGSTGVRTMMGNLSGESATLYLKNYVTGSNDVQVCNGTCRGGFHTYEVMWETTQSIATMDHGASIVNNLQVPTTALPVTLYSYSTSTANLSVDWVYIRKYRDPEPTTAVRDFSDIQQTLSVGLGNNSFDQEHASINVNTLGSLSSVQIVFYQYSHPLADPSEQNGRYWEINPNAGASGFNVDLTLQHSLRPDQNDKLCYYSGGSPAWVCDATSYDPTQYTITLSGLDHLSDWAVQENSPTAVRLKTLRAFSGGNTPWFVAVAIGLAFVCVIAGVIWFIQVRRGSVSR